MKMHTYSEKWLIPCSLKGGRPTPPNIIAYRTVVTFDIVGFKKIELPEDSISTRIDGFFSSIREVSRNYSDSFLLEIYGDSIMFKFENQLSALQFGIEVQKKHIEENENPMTKTSCGISSDFVIENQQNGQIEGPLLYKSIALAGVGNAFSIIIDQNSVQKVDLTQLEYGVDTRERNVIEILGERLTIENAWDFGTLRDIFEIKWYHKRFGLKPGH
jgi:hypothetical protein